MIYSFIKIPESYMICSMVEESEAFLYPAAGIHGPKPVGSR